MTLLATILCLALTRAEILERFRAPVVTQADGLIQVFADCPEDMRREYQMPIASFAAETVKTLYRGLAMKPVRFAKPGVIIHVGDVRTNVSEVVTKVVTNDSRVITRIYVKSPGYADVARLKFEVSKGFYRSVKGEELNDAGVIAALRHADPEMRIEDERAKLDAWVLRAEGDVEDGLKMMRKVITPGRASPREVLVFASRLYLYPPQYDLKFAGKYDCLSFREALKLVKRDPTIRVFAAYKAKEIPVFGGGRGDAMRDAAAAYMMFLLKLAQGEESEERLAELLDDADEKLNVAFEEARKR